MILRILMTQYYTVTLRYVRYQNHSVNIRTSCTVSYGTGTVVNIFKNTSLSQQYGTGTGTGKKYGFVDLNKLWMTI